MAGEDRLRGYYDRLLEEGPSSRPQEDEDLAYERIRQVEVDEAPETRKET